MDNISLEKHPLLFNELSSLITEAESKKTNLKKNEKSRKSHAADFIRDGEIDQAELLHVFDDNGDSVVLEEDFKMLGLTAQQYDKFKVSVWGAIPNIFPKPSDAFEYSLRGKAVFDIGNFRQAAADYSEVIKRQPKNDEALFMRGRSYSEQKLYTEAIADFKEVIQINSDCALAYTRLAIAMLKSSYSHPKARFLEMAKYLNKAIELSSDGISYYYSGYVSKIIGNVQRAREDLIEAINMKDGYAASAHYLLSELEAELKNYDKAIHHLKAAINLDPEFNIPFYKLELVRHFLKLGKYNEMIKYCKQIISSKDAAENIPVHAYFLQGVAKEKLGSEDEAINDYEIIVKNYEAQKSMVLVPEAYYRLGYLKAKRGKHVEAVDDYTKFFDNHIRNDDLLCNGYYQRGISHMKLKKYREAVDDFKTALKILRDYPNIQEPQRNEIQKQLKVAKQALRSKK